MPYTKTLARRRTGFTLVEILGVVVILGICSAVIVPQIATRNDQRAATAARVVMSDLMYAQNRAVAQQKVQYVKFDVAAQRYKVLDRLSPENVVKHPVDGSAFVVQFGTTSTSGLTDMLVHSAAFNGSSTTIAFDVMGIPHAVDPSIGALSPLTTGSVVLRSGTFKMTVTVSPFSGELTVQ